MGLESLEDDRIVKVTQGVVSFKSTLKRMNHLQYSVCVSASARSNPQGIVLRKLISI
jgi:hypothetical protein